MRTTLALTLALLSSTACAERSAPVARSADSSAPEAATQPTASANPASSGAPHAAPTGTTSSGASSGFAACHFAWRSAVSVDFRSKDRLTFALKGAKGSRSFKLGSANITVDHELATPSGFVRVAIHDDRGTELLEQRYPASSGPPENYAPPSHGFTGLSYIAPHGKGDLQYFCTTLPTGHRVETDMDLVVASGHPGVTGREVECTFETAGAAPKKEVVRFKAPSVGQARRDVRIGAYTAAVMWMHGHHEAGAVVLDVSSPTAAMRSFFQTRAAELPASSAGDEFGGVRTHHAGAGEPALRYRCRSV